MGRSTPNGAGDLPRSRSSRASVAVSPTARAAASEPPRPPAPKENANLVEPRRYQVVVEHSFVDPDVRKVLKRLVQNGHEAYLVGGCVRDLLLGRKPKDFDVATSAHPEDVRDLFRNSRIIGRRFRLVHVLFQQRKVIEVATFRTTPENEGALIRSDNVYGTADEDAYRRDFTINALFYDLETNHILDWVGGMSDIQGRVVRTIGVPDVRFYEDPVRILRAIKFAGRLDLGIDADVHEAIVYCRESLKQAARPRVAEEILRLLRGGQARRSLYIAWETGVLDVLLPELSALLYENDRDDSPGARVWRQLAYIDAQHVAGEVLDDTVHWTLLLLETLKEACEGHRDRSAAVGDFVEGLVERLAITRRCADGMRRIIATLPRLRSGKAGKLVRSESYGFALHVAEADRLSEEVGPRPRARQRDASDVDRAGDQAVE